MDDTINNNITPDEVLHYWFGTANDDAAVAKQQAPLWWNKSAATDDAIRTRFLPVVQKAAGGDLDVWRGSARGRLALIILLDQFPRNIFRNTPQAFHYDSTALQLCMEGLAGDEDQQLRPVERVFFYLPLEHSERIEHQARSVTLFEKLHRDVPLTAQPVFAGFVDYALQHRDVIARFGRFPHRNAILGRQSTPEEVAFLAGPNSSF